MSKNRFATFEGVFTPCLLSILGVIMYLRLGWVVGNAGFIGTMTIIGLANLITLTTAFSMSSIITNIRIGTGGAYSIITKSLGVEAGGAIGVPLFISQAVSVAFYITGFTEAWLFVFPQHIPLLVSLAAWVVLFLITLISAKLAFRVQYFILALIVLSLVSIMFSPKVPVANIDLWPNVGVHEFWKVFAIFFPAVTGILAGASMSGELKNPRFSIPVGTISAIVVSFVVYSGLAYWFSSHIPTEELLSNHLVIIDAGRWPVLVILGIMGATISSALAMFVGAPRILMALGKHRIAPFARTFMRLNKNGEPSSAILMTSLIVLITILSSNLDSIAGLLTMFFLITYGMINCTVFIEQSIGIVSFRPSFRVPKIVPFIGGLGCLIVMFLIDLAFSVTAIIAIIVMYTFLIKRGVRGYSPDVRSGFMVFIAEQMAKSANKLPYYPKIWKPNLLVVTADLEGFQRTLSLIRAIVYPTGRVTAFYLTPIAEEGSGPQKAELKKRMKEKLRPLAEDNIFTEGSVIDAPDRLQGMSIMMDTVQGLFFPPNCLFYQLEDDMSADDDVTMRILEKASNGGMGIIVLYLNPKVGLVQEKILNLWIRPDSPNMDLSVLIALQIQANWDGLLRVIQVVEHEHEKFDAEEYLIRMRDIMRMPQNMESQVIVGRFPDILEEAPAADLNMFGMQEHIQVTPIRDVAKRIKTSVLFLKDSKHESALA